MIHIFIEDVYVLTVYNVLETGIQPINDFIIYSFVDRKELDSFSRILNVTIMRSES